MIGPGMGSRQAFGIGSGDGRMPQSRLRLVLGFLRDFLLLAGSLGANAAKIYGETLQKRRQRSQDIGLLG